MLQGESRRPAHGVESGWKVRNRCTQPHWLRLKAFPNSRKNVALRTDGTPSLKASVSALWGPKALDDIVALDLNFEVETEKAVLQRLAVHDIAMYVFFRFLRSRY